MIDKCKKCYEDNKTPDESSCEKCNMTKEIIINCIHKPKGSRRCNAYSNNVFRLDCCEIDNCYYKQLKRLEQENKELKEVLEEEGKIVQCKSGTIITLKLENEQLKEYKVSKENSYENLQQEHKRICKAYKCLEQENIDLEKENSELKTVHKQLKQMIKSKESLLEKAIKENKELKNNMHELEEKFLDLNGKSYSYRKVLEEIRETVKGCETSEGTIRQTITEYLIQNKINEVLKDE